MTEPAININGQMISVPEAYNLVCALYAVARQLAGEFHEKDRSEKFRRNWPNEYKFSEANWKTYVQAARSKFVELLADPKCSESLKRKMFLALVIERKVAQGQEQDLRLQLFPNTQQFEGDPYENKKIAETFGNRPNLRAQLMNSVSSGATIKPH